MERFTFAHSAMATRFEIALFGVNAHQARSVAEEIFHEIDRLESQLSIYRPGSEVSFLNTNAYRGPIQVEPGLFKLIKKSIELSAATGGLFDITSGPLSRCWGFFGEGGRKPDPVSIKQALELVGSKHILLDQNNFTIQFDREGVTLDFGSIGKGFALEKATEVLKDAEVEHALIHGGTSTVVAIGTEPGKKGWSVAIDHEGSADFAKPGFNLSPPLAILGLKDEALSVSAVWGKYFKNEGKKFGHALNPTSGNPSEGHLLAALILPNPTETDALSTAMLIGGQETFPVVKAMRPEAKMMFVSAGEKGDWTTLSDGI